ncbi:MAG: dTDP-4-dehydrorhamnose 3,5-epimerase [Planctomycetaceae bacterium]
MCVIEPRVFRDDRGYFKEIYEQNRYLQAGIKLSFVQDNISRSRENTLRGLHYQIQHPQGKLVQVLRGEIFDVAVDLRRDSATFGKWVGELLSEDNHRQLYIPPGFAHGFLTLNGPADVLYKCTDFYCPESERTLIWNDPDLGIAWPRMSGLIISEKDAQGLPLAECVCYEDSSQLSTHLPGD